jgi:hypothetical protein
MARAFTRPAPPTPPTACTTVCSTPTHRAGSPARPPIADEEHRSRSELLREAMRLCMSGAVEDGPATTPACRRRWRPRTPWPVSPLGPVRIAPSTSAAGGRPADGASGRVGHLGDRQMVSAGGPPHPRLTSTGPVKRRIWRSNASDAADYVNITPWYWSRHDLHKMEKSIYYKCLAA